MKKKSGWKNSIFSNWKHGAIVQWEKKKYKVSYLAYLGFAKKKIKIHCCRSYYISFSFYEILKKLVFFKRHVDKSKNIIFLKL